VPHIIWRGDSLAKLAVCLGVIFVLTSVQQTVYSQSVLVSHWELEEGTGTTTTDSTQTRTATLENGATWTTGVIGSAVDMDGIDDYIALPRLDVTGTAITISAWLKNADFADGVSQRFISKALDSTSEERTYWMLGQTDTNGQARLEFRLRANRITTTLIASTGNLPLNTWYHAAATYDGSTMRLYLNGIEVGAVEKTGSISRGSNASTNIGRSPEGSNYLRGAIDDVRIYSSVLSSTEVAALMSPGSVVNRPPSVSLSSPADGAIYSAGSTIDVSATARDVDGTIARVDFYSGTALIGSDTSSPYGMSWRNVTSGDYAMTAVARDNGGAATVSSTRDIIVTSANLSTTAVFVPSSNDATAVDRYVLEIFPLGADPRVANPVATRDLGKPPVSNGECRADVSSTFIALIPGTYIATITAMGDGGSAQSEPSPQFVR
jgi:hypothetical protein